MRLRLVYARLLAAFVCSVVVLAACGSDDAIVAESVTDLPADGAAGGCDSAAVAAALAPGSTFDYEPSDSPADLAASVDIVFRADVVSSIQIGREWSTITVDAVELIVDRREVAEPITHFGAFGAGVDAVEAPADSVVEGLAVLVFAHATAGAPGGLSAAVEGLWVQCPNEPPRSVVASPDGEAWYKASRSLDAIAAATAGREPAGDVTLNAEAGEGWRLVTVEPGFGRPHEVAIVTTDLGLDRAADDRWFESRPAVDFAEEIVVVLAPAVSGSCPAIAFDGLTIAADRVFGRFAPGPPPAGTDVCTSDANPISFVLAVERDALPDRFALSVGEEVVCLGCDRATIDVDLTDEAALEAAQWAAGTLDIVIDGTPPADGTANVFRWAPEAALLLHAVEFVDLPRWIQSFESSEPRTIEGFVVDCDAGGCPEECDDGSCGELVPLGEVCTYHYEPEAFVDRTVLITWAGLDCEITATAGASGQ